MKKYYVRCARGGFEINNAGNRKCDAKKPVPDRFEGGDGIAEE